MSIFTSFNERGLGVWDWRMMTGLVLACFFVGAAIGSALWG